MAQLNPKEMQQALALPFAPEASTAVPMSRFCLLI